MEASERESWNFPRRNISRLLIAYYQYILVGMGESVIGVLIPQLQDQYHLSYLVVSLVFVPPVVGFIVAALLSDGVHRLGGRRLTTIIGPLCQMICFIVALCKPPFPVFAVFYGFVGFGDGLLDSTHNAWLGTLKQDNECLGLFHASYALGGIIAPTIITSLGNRGYSWNIGFAIFIALAALSMVLGAIGFWPEHRDLYRQRVLVSTDENADEEEDQTIETTTTTTNYNNEKAVAASGNNEKSDTASNYGDQTLQMRQNSAMVFKSVLVWLVAITLLVYTGAEIVVGDWITTFMIEVRHGDPTKMGYVSTGYWSGLTLGRAVLGFLIGKLGREQVFASGYMAASIGIVLVLWLVPNLYVTATMAGLFGLVMGPILPTVIIVALRRLPVHLHVSGIGFASAIAGTGAALFPFINGALSDAYGPWVIGPYGLSLLAVMFVTWLGVLKLRVK